MTTAAVHTIAAELTAACHRLERRGNRDPRLARIARLVGRIGTRLARPPRIVVLGEFNAGKSTVANALIGSELLPTSVHANTRIPIHIKYAQFPILSVERSNGVHEALSFNAPPPVDPRQARMLHLGLPVERLKTFELIDTPGLAQGQSHLDSLTRAAAGRANFALWCTTATQAWKATERSVWLSLPQRLRASSVLAITQLDGVNDERAVARLRQRIEAEVAPLFRSYAMLSGAAAADSARNRPNPAWEASGGAALEDCVARSIAVEMTKRFESAERLLSRVADRLTAGSAPAPAATPAKAAALVA